MCKETLGKGSDSGDGMERLEVGKVVTQEGHVALGKMGIVNWLYEESTIIRADESQRGFQLVCH